ncbi:hypothetical protein EYB33_07775 [Lysinibacillus sphaericus]|uniref:DUF1617 family protein n=1 Tax=Lysinibacillus varians TaxID=1145276 RepID=A0ABY2TIR0_9BACI|nr:MULTISPECIES: hypothetical protein [Lysinibacillus]AHN24031.1 hypothetical protein T479_07155 [Lysinibacillus varians]MCS1382587.1 hypothetical protein [Lysinibacillus sphaericus]TKI67313.1 hypothetical protein FC752_01995 [Lysinibacillus varians]UDK96199.1 hypothetical protein EYB33_07775 [Lysinibacillus sphaericus]
MIIKNYEISELYAFLFNLILKGKESRMRTRFLKLLEDQLNLVNQERQQLVADYADKDDNGEVLYNKEIVDNKEIEIPIFGKDAEKEVQRQILTLLHEDFIIEETADKIDMLQVLQEILLNLDLEFTGKKATLYNRYCEIFEDIQLLEKQ